ncbi:MAG: UDP-2,3-diacylglucosamine diphosphatase [Cyclobacteriaceae bacterium]
MQKLDLHIPIHLPKEKKIYFASDFHLGAPNAEQSRLREEVITDWFDSIRHDAHLIFLIGDLFDFWFEYRYVIPKGFLRFQAKLVQLVEQGIFLVIFTGNHDLWMFDYFEQELGIPIIRQPISVQISDHNFHLGHGDGLGPGDSFYKMLKKGFTSKTCQRLFSLIHPDVGMYLANLWSKKSRLKNEKEDESFRGPEHEWIYQYCVEVETHQHHDYYVFGHRHLPLDIPVSDASRYYNIGEWISQQSYGVFDGQQFQLQTFRK